MLGQGIVPETYHPFVDNLSDAQLKTFMDEVKANVSNIVARTPSHYDFLQHYCKAGNR